ncbi:MAG TPA: hypothetical protein ENN22_07705, partial [bacterium]|nr:hypothetical protein [bacterium]
PVVWPSRYDKIPADAVKYTSEMDIFPPVVHSEQWQTPVPLPGPINTAGAEDAPVITPDGKKFFFFFTPDVDVPPEQQLLDSVTGIWWSQKNGDQWTEPERILLSEGLALDGPMCIQGDTLWFASFRQGNYRDDGDIYIARYSDDKWGNWQNAGAQLNDQFNIGELYTSRDGKTIIFHRAGDDGFGGYDLWRTDRQNDLWSQPVNLGEKINTEHSESHPFYSSATNELWFTSPSRKGYTGPALFRAMLIDGNWTTPEEIISNFAGDPAVDDQGNVYFTHHFFDQQMKMIEADIYVAYKK